MHLSQIWKDVNIFLNEKFQFLNFANKSINMFLQNVIWFIYTKGTMTLKLRNSCDMLLMVLLSWGAKWMVFATDNRTIEVMPEG